MTRPGKPKPSESTERRRPSLAQAAARAAEVLARTPPGTGASVSATAGAGAPGAKRRRSADVVEATLLGLARDVSQLTARGGSLRDGLVLVAHAWSDATLGRGRLQALLDHDEARSLALAWAREQLRLALEELVTRRLDAGDVRTDVPASALAWALLAGCEAIALDPPGGADERIEALLMLVRSA